VHIVLGIRNRPAERSNTDGVHVECLRMGWWLVVGGWWSTSNRRLRQSSTDHRHAKWSTEISNSRSGIAVRCIVRLKRAVRVSLAHTHADQQSAAQFAHGINCALGRVKSRAPMAERLHVEGELKSLADKLDRLLSANARLFEENRNLRAAQEQLAQERSALLAKNENARSRVEAMITRLKLLEQNG